jgi:hypothetical protein
MGSPELTVGHYIVGQHVLYSSGDLRGDSWAERWALHCAFDDPFAAREYCWRRGKFPLRVNAMCEISRAC